MCEEQGGGYSFENPNIVVSLFKQERLINTLGDMEAK